MACATQSRVMSDAKQIEGYIAELAEGLSDAVELLEKRTDERNEAYSISHQVFAKYQELFQKPAPPPMKVNLDYKRMKANPKNLLKAYRDAANEHVDFLATYEQHGFIPQK